MKYLDIKNKKNRFFAKILEKNVFLYKTVLTNMNLSEIARAKALNEMLVKKKPETIETPFFKTSINNRCIVSKRKKRGNKIANVSRLVLLNYARSGYLCGVRKAVW